MSFGENTDPVTYRETCDIETEFLIADRWGNSCVYKVPKGTHLIVLFNGDQFFWKRGIYMETNGFNFNEHFQKQQIDGEPHVYVFCGTTRPTTSRERAAYVGVHRLSHVETVRRNADGSCWFRMRGGKVFEINRTPHISCFLRACKAESKKRQEAGKDEIDISDFENYSCHFEWW